MKTELLIAFVVCTFASALVTGMGVYYLFKPEPHRGFCHYESPREITTRVMGVEGPAVAEGRVVTELAQRCVEGVDLLGVYAYRYFDPVDDDGTRDMDRGRVVSLDGLEQPRARGNNVQETQVQLPPEVGPGKWRLSGIDVSIQTGEIRTWFSDTFTVVGAR